MFIGMWASDGIIRPPRWRLQGPIPYRFAPLATALCLEALLGVTHGRNAGRWVHTETHFTRNDVIILLKNRGRSAVLDANV